MKLASPAELEAESQTPDVTRTVSESLESCPQTFPDRAALLSDVEQLASTSSVAETLETTVRLLAEIGIPVTSLRLDRNGFVTVWKTPGTSEVLPELKGAADTRISECLVRLGATSIEARYRGTSGKLAERAVGAFLKAAAIQAERLSRRLWRHAAAEHSTETHTPLSEKARALEADLERVSRLPYNVLITGETGTGKTVSARRIHKRSARARKPFMELNCAALPEHLVEAELFGYRKGAFTGADRDHKGLFEEADGGILFLDEVGDIPVTVQNKLLKAIDEKQIKRLGTNAYVACDVQIIAATSRDLRAMIRQGTFREDLYCRLAVLQFEIAPLRERREDIPALIDLFLREAADTVTRLTGRGEEYGIEAGAVEMLCAFDWAGNIRVLRNTLYELTSYVAGGEPITMERVRETLDRLSAQAAGGASPALKELASETGRANDSPRSLAEIAEALRALAEEGDIVLPLEICFLRRGETLKEWLLRAKQSSIETAWRASSTGRMREAATRLGLTHTNLKSQLHRTRSRLSEPRNLADAR